MTTLYTLILPSNGTIRSTTDRKLAALYLRTMREFAAQHTDRWYAEPSTGKPLRYTAAPEKVVVRVTHLGDVKHKEPQYKIVRKYWDGSYEVTVCDRHTLFETRLHHRRDLDVSLKLNKNKEITTLIVEDSDSHLNLVESVLKYGNGSQAQSVHSFSE